MTPTTLVALVLSLSGVARTSLQYFTLSPVEQLGCLIGTVRGDTLVVDSVLPLKAEQATRTVVTTVEECPAGAIGRVHSHPDAKFCWYTFPGTAVPSSDAVSFRRSPYPVDAIVCGSKLVWVDRALNQHEQVL